MVKFDHELRISINRALFTQNAPHGVQDKYIYAIVLSQTVQIANLYLK